MSVRGGERVEVHVYEECETPPPVSLRVQFFLGEKQRKERKEGVAASKKSCDKKNFRERARLIPPFFLWVSHPPRTYFLFTNVLLFSSVTPACDARVDQSKLHLAGSTRDPDRGGVDLEWG